MKILVYNEYAPHQKHGKILKAYPNGLHNAIKDIFESDNNYTVNTCTLQDIESKMTQDALNDTDLIIWWGHCLHDKVPDRIVDMIVNRVNEGMGAIFLHSSHFSKPFTRLMGTSCSLRWRENNERERVWTVSPNHPIASGVDQGFVLPHEEMYGEHFDIPSPDEVVFVGWFEGGEVFRSGCTFTRGKGKIFYLQCGHETHPIYSDKNIVKIIYNAARWATNKPLRNDFKANSKCLNPVLAPEKFVWLRRK